MPAINANAAARNVCRMGPSFGASSDAIHDRFCGSVSTTDVNRALNPRADEARKHEMTQTAYQWKNGSDCQDWTVFGA
jgi:hypothetical protein